MLERRRIKRRHLFYHLRVFERGTERLLGYLVDITPEGIMLISDQPIAADTIYPLRMILPAEILGRREMDFDARSVWCRSDEDSTDFFNVGFRLLDVPWEEKMVIEQLVDDYGAVEA